MAAVTYLYLPNRPESTAYLTEPERKIAVARMNRGASGDVGAVVNRGRWNPGLNTALASTDVISAHIMAAFRDWRVNLFGNHN